MTQLANTNIESLLPANLTTNENFDEKALREISKVGDYLPRLQLFGSRSTDAGAGRIAIGHYGLKRSSDDLIDLGVEPIIIPINYRPMAIEFADDDFNAFFDINSPEFQDIQRRSEEPNSGCQYGPDFLVYVPETDDLATFFCGSKTARKIGPHVFKLLGKPAQLKAKFIESGKFSWHGPVIFPWNSVVSKTPDIERVTKAVEKFKNPPKSEAVKADAAPGERPR